MREILAVVCGVSYLIRSRLVYCLRALVPMRCMAGCQASEA